VDTLISAGYRAAALLPELVDVEHECSQNEVLSIITSAVEAEVTAAPGHEGEGVTAMHTALSSLACATLCWDWDSVIAGPICTGCTGPVAGWTFVGGPFENALHCAVTCSYSATITCTYSRTVLTTNWDCSTCICTQTKSVQSDLQRASTFYLTPPNCGIPPGYACPGGPNNSGFVCGDADAPGPGLSWVGWTACPCD